MPPAQEWLKPPRSLLAILFLVTLVSVSSLAWFGWKLLDQERVVEVQRSQERLDQAADRIAVIARGMLAETGERLGNSAVIPSATAAQAGGPQKDELLLTFSGTDPAVTAQPPGRLLYRPEVSPEIDLSSGIFSDGELLEFQHALPDRAIANYRHLTDSGNSGVRAGALMRIARVLRNDGAR